MNRIGNETSKSRGYTAKTPSSDTNKSTHFIDYFAILREHKWIAMLPFALILGATAVYTLLTDPIYASQAVIEIETDAGKDAVLGELGLVSARATVEAEMEIMQSRRVARGAAKDLAAKDRSLGDFLVEENAHRPFEVMLAAFNGSPRKATVELRTKPLSGRKSPQTFVFAFDRVLSDGRYRIDVEKVRRSRFRDQREVESRDIESGKSFEAFGHVFALTVTGQPAGRRYEITLRNEKALANWLRAHTTVAEQGRGTGIVGLTVEAPTPRMAQACAEVLANSFVKVKFDKKQGDAGKAETYLADRVETVEIDLKKAESALEAFQDAEGVTLLSERAKTLVESIAEYEREDVDLELRLRANRELITSLRLNELAPNLAMLHIGRDDPAGAKLAEEVTTLDLARETLDDDLTDKHPDVMSLNGRLMAARERLRLHVLARTEADGETLSRRQVEVRKGLKAAKKKEAGLPGTERRLASHTRAVAAFVTIHAFLLEKKHEAGIVHASTLNHVSVLDEPELPRSRVSPNLLVNFLVGMFLAILAALGTAFFAEYLDRSLKTPEDLEEKTGLPLYAALPSFKSVGSREAKKLKSQMVTIEQPHSILAEGYRSLRANVKFADFESPVKTMAITSAVLGEGKTTTALNLAVVLAQAGSRVVVVDADLRRPATHAHLNGTLSPGLTDVLLKGNAWRDVVRPVEGVENLQVIHAGKKADNPGALLDSDRFQCLIAELKEEYDYLVFDVPPVLAVADAASFFSGLDAVFLLVQWRRCPAEVVLAARDQIIRLGGNLRGVIFNGFDARKAGRRGYSRYGYYGYYGGYRYGYGYHGYGGDRDDDTPARKRGGAKVKTKS